MKNVYLNCYAFMYYVLVFYLFSQLLFNQGVSVSYNYMIHKYCPEIF